MPDFSLHTPRFSAKNTKKEVLTLKEKRKAVDPKPTETALNAAKQPPSDCDPLGMYTGRPVPPDAVPVQDSDDL